MALIRLVKDAPWPMVTLPSGLIVSKNKFIEQGDESILCIQQWVEEYKEPEPEAPPVEEPKPVYESMTKLDLRLLCKERNIPYEDTMKKEDLIKLLKENDNTKK